MRFWGSGALAAGVFLTYLIPETLLFIPLFKIFAFVQDWTGIELMNHWWILIVIFPTLTVPFCTWIMIGYFASIPKELDEAALIDGAGYLQVLTRIFLPVALPGVIAATIFAFTVSWADFLYPMAFATSIDQMVLPAGIVSTLIKGGVCNWGEILIGGDVVNDVPPKDRDIAMVFQNYALYPHMTVHENMSFGLRLKKLPKDEIRRRVAAVAGILGIGELLDRKPKQLSGGQRQRVAMGRAIVRNPKVFLFDEPLSNLDAKLRVHMRTEIQKVHQKVRPTTVDVTHDQVAALTLAYRGVVMNAGLIEGHRFRLVVRDVDGGGAHFLVHLLDLGAHEHAQLRVEVGERLVEQEHLGIAHDGAPHGDALALAARELLRLPVEQLADAEDAGDRRHASPNLG